MRDLTNISDMFNPVRCTCCGNVYDLGKVEVTARYTDCSVWKAPCCQRVVDDRGETGWSLRKDYEPIDKDRVSHGGYYMDGQPMWRQW